MRRLTKKSDKLGYCLRHSSISVNQCWNKLGQYEDIEKKYEIDDFKDLDERLRAYKFLANHEYSTLERRDLNQMIDICQNVYTIEEELGIDLITLFKAFKNGIWFKFNAGSKTYNYKTGEDKETDSQIVFHKAPYKTLAENIAYFRRLFEKEYARNYGKTWALTKEELKGKNNG